MESSFWTTRRKKTKVSLSSADTIGTKALTCSKDRKMYIVLGKTTQAYLEKTTQCKLVGKYCYKDLYMPGLVGEF